MTIEKWVKSSLVSGPQILENFLILSGNIFCWDLTELFVNWKKILQNLKDTYKSGFPNSKIC